MSIFHIIKEHLCSAQQVLEAGAKLGTDTIQLSRLWPGVHVYAFEPIQELFEKTTENTKHCRNISLYPIALASTTGKATMYISEGQSQGSSSLREPKEHLTYHPKTVFKRTIQVQTITIDDWAQKHGIDNIDFIWLDTQGTEFDILKASPRILQKVKALYLEVSLKEMYAGAALYSQVRSWVEGQGFDVVYEELLWEDMGNVLFVRK